MIRCAALVLGALVLAGCAGDEPAPPASETPNYGVKAEEFFEPEPTMSPAQLAGDERTDWPEGEDFMQIVWDDQTPEMQMTLCVRFHEDSDAVVNAFDETFYPTVDSGEAYRFLVDRCGVPRG